MTTLNRTGGGPPIWLSTLESPGRGSRYQILRTPGHFPGCCRCDRFGIDGTSVRRLGRVSTGTNPVLDGSSFVFLLFSLGEVRSFPFLETPFLARRMQDLT